MAVGHYKSSHKFKFCFSVSIIGFLLFTNSHPGYGSYTMVSVAVRAHSPAKGSTPTVGFMGSLELSELTACFNMAGNQQ